MQNRSIAFSGGVTRRQIPTRSPDLGLENLRENGARRGSVFSFRTCPEGQDAGEGPTASKTVASGSTPKGNSSEVVGSFATFRLRI